MTDKLRECPFCGGNNVDVFNWEVTFQGDYFKAYCKDCDFELKPQRTEEEAIKAWNKRSYIDEIVEQLEEEKNHCCVGCYEDYDPYEDGRFETYEEVIALLKGVQNE